MTSGGRILNWNVYLNSPVMASRTWRRLFNNSLFSFDFLRFHQINRLVRSENHFKVFKLESTLNNHRSTKNLFLSFIFKHLFDEKKKIFRKSRSFFRPKVIQMAEEFCEEDESVFAPPKSVRGMKKLDRTAFERIVKIPALKVPIRHVNKLHKQLKKSLCKIVKVRPIAELSNDDPSKNDYRLFLLKPDKYTNADSFDDRECQLLKEAGIDLLKDFLWTDIQLSYENWSSSQILRAIIPDDHDNVSGFTHVGHIAHLNLRDNVIDFKYIIGEVLLDKVPTIKTVVNKLNVIDNTFRNFEMELLAGEKDFFTTVRENKCVYQFDFDKVYWNSRLGKEHERIINQFKKGDIVFDVFAGVGPFSLPAAKKGCHVFANDLNPESFKWLTHNKTLNKIKTDSFESFNLDGREFIRLKLKSFLLSKWQEFISDSKKETKKTEPKFHIVMNLPALAVQFMDTFPSLFEDLPEVLERLDEDYLPWIYCYCFYKGDNPEEEIKERVFKILNSVEEDFQNFEIRFVRNVAPNKDMYCVQFVMPVRILGGKSLNRSENKDSSQNLEIEMFQEADVSSSKMFQEADVSSSKMFQEADVSSSKMFQEAKRRRIETEMGIKKKTTFLEDF